MDALVNCKLVFPDEVREGTLLMDGGKIVAAGAVEIPEGAKIIDAQGAYAGPGLFDIHCHVALREHTPKVEVKPGEKRTVTWPSLVADQNSIEDLKGLKFRVPNEAMPIAGVGALGAALICTGLGYIRKILAPMAEGRPFHPDTAVYIRKLAIVSLILGIAQNIGAFAETFSALRSFGLDSLIDAGIIQSVSVNFTLELGFIIVFFVLLLMSYLFSYGAQLQQLSDETL